MPKRVITYNLIYLALSRLHSLPSINSKSLNYVEDINIHYIDLVSVMHGKYIQY